MKQEQVACGPIAAGYTSSEHWRLIGLPLVDVIDLPDVVGIRVGGLLLWLGWTR